MTTKLALLAVFTATGLVGCGPYTGPMGGPSTGSYGGLSAYLVPSGSALNSGFNIDVNDQAYAAVFRIIPGAGVSMVYPRPGMGSMDGQLRAGLNWVSERRMHFSDTNFSFASIPGGPEYYLLIASEEPLRLDQFGPFGDNLQFRLGASYASGSAYPTMERLVLASVPNVEAGNWTTDFYVHWPEMTRNAPGGDLVAIACEDQIFYVPRRFVLQAYAQLCPVETDEDGAATQQPPSDSTGVVEPRRRPPPELLIEDRIASTQLQEPEEFVARQEAAAEGRAYQSRSSRPNGVRDAVSREPLDDGSARARGGDRFGGTRDGVGGRESTSNGGGTRDGGSGGARDSGSSGGASSRGPSSSPPTRSGADSPSGVASPDRLDP